MIARIWSISEIYARNIDKRLKQVTNEICHRTNLFLCTMGCKLIFDVVQKTIIITACISHTIFCWICNRTMTESIRIFGNDSRQNFCCFWTICTFWHNYYFVLFLFVSCIAICFNGSSKRIYQNFSKIFRYTTETFFGIFYQCFFIFFCFSTGVEIKEES